KSAPGGLKVRDAGQVFNHISVTEGPTPEKSLYCRERLAGRGGAQFSTVKVWLKVPMRILFVASEGLPFSKTGGLADVVEALPKALVAQGHDVAVVLPRYRNTQVKKIVIKSLTVPMGTALRFPAIASGARLSGVQYFFVDDPEYFDRDQLYGVGGQDYPDNAERFAEF